MANEALQRALRWPQDITVEALDAVIARIQRFVDFDGTIVDSDNRMRSDMAGTPMEDFLRERHYVLQTWNPIGAEEWFLTNPQVSPPTLIIEPPMACWIDGVLVRAPMDNPWPRETLSYPGRCKDFEILGLTGITIYDDDRIHAPGCTVIKPW